MSDRGPIVSLLPSATEWVHALGVADRLAGVTFECDYPASARTDARVVVTGWDTSGLTPGQIDAGVRERVARGVSLHQLDAAAVRAIAPGVVLAQDLCHVCALPAGEVEAATATLGNPPIVVTLDPRRLTDVLADAVTVGNACGVRAAGEALSAELTARLAAVEHAVAGRPKPRVLVVEWTDPIFVAGHWVPDLVTAAGGVPVAARAGGRSIAVTPDDLHAELEATGVDAVLVAPCGEGLSEASRQARALDLRSVLPTQTVMNDSVVVWAIDAGAVVTGPGPRLIDGVEALAAAWHPDSGVIPRPDLVAAITSPTENLAS